MEQDELISRLMKKFKIDEVTEEDEKPVCAECGTDRVDVIQAASDDEIDEVYYQTVCGECGWCSDVD